MKKLLKSSILLAAALASGAAFSQDEEAPTGVQCFNITDFTQVANQTGGYQMGTCLTPEGTGASKRSDKRLYMGLVWSLGKNASKTPDVLVGFRSTQINSSNSVKGADLSLRLQSAKEFAVEGFRLSYLGGNRNTLANIGAGYSFASNSALVTAAVQAAHVRAGTDYLLASKNFKPYLEANTLQRIKPTGSSYSCSIGNLRTLDKNVAISQNDVYKLLNPTARSEFLSSIGNNLVTVDVEGETPSTIPAGSTTCFEPVPV